MSDSLRRASIAKAFVLDLVGRGVEKITDPAVEYHLALLLRPEGHPTIRTSDSASQPQFANTQEKPMSNEIPRRSRIDLFTPAEKAIHEAAAAVEALPPDVRLTHAGNKLQEARALVADFVDGVPFGEGYPRSGGGASFAGWPSVEMINAMTPAERSAFVASAPQILALTSGATTITGGTPSGYVPMPKVSG